MGEERRNFSFSLNVCEGIIIVKEKLILAFIAIRRCFQVVISSLVAGESFRNTRILW